MCHDFGGPGDGRGAPAARCEVAAGPWCIHGQQEQRRREKIHKTFKAEVDDEGSIKAAFALAVQWMDAKAIADQ